MDELTWPSASDFSLRSILKKSPVISMASTIADTLNRSFADQLETARRTFTSQSQFVDLMLVPPLFPEYVLEIVNASGRADHIFVCYLDPEHVYLLYFADGKKWLSINLDNASFDADTGNLVLHMDALSAAFEKLPRDQQERYLRMVLYLFISASRYMEFYSPDVEYLPPPERSASPARPPRYGSPRREVILRSKRKRYLISDPTPRRPANYSRPSWYRRGHYRRVGKDKHWAYIPPTMAYRHALSDRPKHAPPTRYKIK